VATTTANAKLGSARDPDRLFAGALKRFLAHRLAVVGLGALLLLLVGAIFAPVLTPYGVRDQDLFNTLAAPSWAHPLGTDELGRDLLTRLFYGGRVSLSVGLLSTAVAVLVGLVVGSLAGLFGGWLDRVLMRFIDLMLVFPALILLILFASLFGTSYLTIVLVLGAVSWMTVARLVRAAFLELKPKAFVEASRALGSSHLRLCLKHLLPNALGPVIVAATLNTASAIIAESTLSFLGLGIQPPTPSWGNMLQNAQAQMTSAPWTAVFPGLMIFLTVISINFVGDALRDALDPRHVST
jgi:peptide/nickel transport system permease protein